MSLFKLFQPKHTFESVVHELVRGLEQGAIRLETPSLESGVEDSGKAQELFNLTRRHPFVRFRIVTDRGHVREVSNPHLVMIGLSSVIVRSSASPESDISARWEVIPLHRVARLELDKEATAGDPMSQDVR